MTLALRTRRAPLPCSDLALVALLCAFLAACGDGAAPPGSGVDATVPPADLGVDAMVLDLGAPDMTGPCVDADGDGARDAACGGTDCDDANPSRYPGAAEVCDAADLDEDCDPETFGFRDADGDGFPDARCCNGTTCGDDCNDTRPGVNLAVPEVCNAVDDDCDGRTDEELLVMLYTDADRDGFGAGTPVTGCPGMTGTVTNGDDCDDARPSSNPAAMEACDGTADDDCDGTVDEGCGCVTGTTQTCGTDTGVCEVGTQECIAGAWAMCTAVVAGTESCNGLDDDCDGMTDEGLLVSSCYSDGDADGFGTGAPSMQCRDMTRDRFGFCPAGYTNSASPLDCNDSIAEVRPGGIERCDTFDNDCDGVVDDVLGLGDACTNGVGSCARSGSLACGSGMLVCSAVAGTPVAEACNGLDDDCDGVADDGLDTVFGCRVDADADGFGIGEPTTQCASNDLARAPFGRCPAGYTNAAPLDCNDASAAIRPTASETCNAVDEDCDGLVDNGVTRACGTAVGIGVCTLGVQACAGGLWGACSGVAPSPEICDGLDQDCDGAVDEGVTTDYYLDMDLDGFGSIGRYPACAAPIGYYVANNRDCDDTSRTKYPGAPELCNGTDDDCNGAPETSCECVPGATLPCGFNRGRCTVGVQTCSGSSWTACSGTTPAAETCNGIDDDCDGAVDEAPPQLTGLTVSGVSLSPSFASGTISYGATAEPGATACVVQPMVACGALTVRVDGVPVASGGAATVQLNRYGPQRISVLVTASDGASRTYTVNVQRQSAYWKASNAGSADTFGRSVAVSSDGTTVAVGASGESSSAIGVGGDQIDNRTDRSGAVYVFRRSAVGVWVQEAYVKASNTGRDDAFGVALSLSADGTVLAVGASGEDSAATRMDGDQASDGATNSGAVYVFRRAAGIWAQEAYVKASNTGANDSFGSAVSLSADGSRLAVGASREDSPALGIGGDEAIDAATDSGAVYLFRRGAGSWTQEAYMKASNTGANDEFGSSVALSADGATLAVGASQEDSAASGVGGDQTSDAATNAGAVYVFRRSAVDAWSQEAYVKASNSGANDFFGSSVAISEGGATLAVGAFGEDSAATGVGGDQASNASSQAGAVYVFRRSAVGVWAQEVYVKSSNTGMNDYLGHSVALSADGATLAVGAIYEDSAATGVGGDQASNAASGSGAVYVFRRSVGGVWAQEAYVKASNTGSGDGFGWSVALSGDGSTLAVGANAEDSAATGIGGDQTSNAVTDSGAVYVF